MSGGGRTYFGNLEPSVTKEQLEDLCSGYGKVADVWVARNPPGFAFVVRLACLLFPFGTGCFFSPHNHEHSKIACASPQEKCRMSRIHSAHSPPCPSHPFRPSRTSGTRRMPCAGAMVKTSEGAECASRWQRTAAAAAPGRAE